MCAHLSAYLCNRPGLLRGGARYLTSYCSIQVQLYSINGKRECHTGITNNKEIKSTCMKDSQSTSVQQVLMHKDYLRSVYLYYICNHHCFDLIHSHL